MRSLPKVLVVSAMMFFLGVTAYAEKPTPITSLTCTGGSFMDITSAAVYAYAFSTGNSSPQYFTAYLSGAMFTELVRDEVVSGPYKRCVFANLNGVTPVTVTIVAVTSIGVGIDVDAGPLSEDSIKQLFTEVDFSYDGFILGNNQNVISGPVGTPEEQEKAFQAFKARGISLPRR